MSKWIKCSDRLPSTPSDSDTTMIVAVFRQRTGKTYVFSAEWLNEKLLRSADDDADDPEDGRPFTGWFSIQPHDDFEEYWEPLVSPSSGDEVTHWQRMPSEPKG